MTTFRLRRPKFSHFSFSSKIIQSPLLIFLFIYFLTSSADLLHAHLLFFNIKLTNAIALSLCLFISLFRPFRIPKNDSVLLLAFLSCMALSLLNSPNLVVSLGFIIFFTFNFFFYFTIPYSLFRFIQPDLLLKIYSASFYWAGTYTFLQVLFSLLHIVLPGVTQYIGPIARGSFFAYEPSYYALYMTPFAVYTTMKFILQDRSVRKIRDVFWPNFFLLISTSTGCFFTYLFFFATILIFQKFHLIQISIKKLLIQLTVTVSSLFLLLFSVSPKLITAGLLKFFYGSKASHFSIQDRWRGIGEYFNIFLEHPMFGVSFGGGPFYLAEKAGENAEDLLAPNALIPYTPTNVTTEILASMGILGVFCFSFFLYLLVRNFRSALRSCQNSDERVILISFAISICVMLMTLQFNQSIMRAYMWIHIGIFCGYTKHLRTKALAF